MKWPVYQVSTIENLKVLLLQPANEVWGKVICLQVCVSPQGWVPARGGGGVPALEGCLLLGGVPAPGGAYSWGGACPGKGCLLLEGCLVVTPPMATAAGGTHPTGMHSRLLLQIVSKSIPLQWIKIIGVHNYSGFIHAAVLYFSLYILQCNRWTRNTIMGTRICAT